MTLAETIVERLEKRFDISFLRDHILYKKEKEVIYAFLVTQYTVVKTANKLFSIRFSHIRLTFFHCAASAADCTPSCIKQNQFSDYLSQ